MFFMAIAKGQFIPKNPQKYLGNTNEITYRSSWELTMFLYIDQHPMILGWLSEALPTHTIHQGISGIPYRNPLTGKWSIYVPDLFVVYVDKNKKQHAEVIEIKPMAEVPGYQGKTNKIQKAREIVNAAKFKAAIVFCASRGWKFRIATENELFKKPSQI